MPRQARKKSKTGIYHIMLRGINQQQIFEDSEDFSKFLQVLKDCKAISEFEIYAYCLMGNHDAFVLTPQRFYSVLGTESPKSTCIDGRNLVFLDACYFSSGEHYAPGDSDWTDTFYPFADKLKAELEALSFPTYVFIHQNIDPEIPCNHRLFNADEILHIIEQRGIVKAVFQGHYHPGAESVHSGIRYITLPAMCENESAYWVFEL